MTASSDPTAALIVIGNEILSGRTRDANLTYLGVRLAELGIRFVEARVVRDETAAIVAAVNELRARCDYVFTTGGIGPTHDDITAAAVARAFGVEIWRDPEAVRRLRRNYPPGFELNETRLKMCDVPRGAVLIDNPVSHAPGFRMGNVYVMAGIPKIMQTMFEGIAGELRRGRPMLSAALSALLPEGEVGAPLADIQARFPDVELGSYPFKRDCKAGATLVGRARDEGRLAEAMAAVEAMVRALGAAPMDDSDL